MRMNLDTIKALIDSMAGSSRPEAECREGDWTLKLTRRLPPSETVMQADRDQGAADGSAKVVSPLYGIVHLQPSPDAPPFVTVGQQVAIGAPLCVVEAMKVFNHVTAERAGTIEAIVIGNGEEVDVGQLLMSIA
jgi:acetyl-CoA carboxylase biotin carboxyl carrier protein